MAFALKSATAARSVAVRSVSGKASTAKGKTAAGVAGKTLSGRECEWPSPSLACAGSSLCACQALPARGAMPQQATPTAYA